ncbi:low-density lipoprotein receptor class A domain-containing protein 4 isoform X2 [Electrophorus electricus]|uniref:low-density lipoprotein receptor class A domain-containing protein 4 isoform X2 n=1 Tax=Electrophorus electricus TaxID=8005 RepID=UPI0015D04A89|nr:low-density lipoprotein receptor class A domain-containing protein 4 isoform X2 [Electrophorus electricus]XP_035384669.1 low-density lipoprotein receptor class A domain-containing protein 4 isoform X2 [Electrophorus electricus]XP_035384670.1 low-density lipoprotein receptor class A domain-containing protein 4 isoform X2 [Electrophorus electricus]XP_035384671.1 low-density lipoprotein receptor class A domain-containing protein 4 isoform X2 [Electrophorus electricus]XP_035384672.1 low-density 
MTAVTTAMRRAVPPSCQWCPPPPPPHQAELEFVQIIIIIVVMTVMVVVIICLLNHYRLSAWALFSQQSQAHRREEALQPDGCTWPTDSAVMPHGPTEVMYGQRSGDRYSAPSLMQRERFGRFQPTYPYMQQDIDLPPNICLSDGEELPPYKGPCTLQLRDPEQQLELSRASVRAPPNRTIFDSDLIDVYVHGGGPKPPSSNSGKSASNLRMEGPPPTYSEVIGQSYPGSASFMHQHSNNASVSNQRTVSRSTQPSASTTGSLKMKDSRHDKPV